MNSSTMDKMIESWRQQESEISIKLIERLVVAYVDTNDSRKQDFLEKKITEILDLMNTPVFIKDK